MCLNLHKQCMCVYAHCVFIHSLLQGKLKLFLCLTPDWFRTLQAWLLIGSPQACHSSVRIQDCVCVCVPVGSSDIYSRVRSLFNHCLWVSLGCFACSNFRQLMPYLVLTNRSPVHGTLNWDRGFRAGLAVLTGVKHRYKRSRAVCVHVNVYVPACSQHISHLTLNPAHLRT